jgi:hypothetical protein
MNITTLSLIALLAATMSAHASAQMFNTRRVKRNRNRNTRLQRDARRAQMRKLVDAMSADPDPAPTTPPPAPTPETPSPKADDADPPTKKPTKKPTSCEHSLPEHTVVTLSKTEVKYIGEGKCKDASGNTYSYAELRESCDDFDDCVDMCEEAGVAGFVGIQFTCGDDDEDDEGLCECLFSSDTKSASANELNHDFEKVVIDSGTGTPVKTKSKSRFGLKARLNKGHIECGAVQSDDGSSVGDYDTLDEWFAKEA